MVIIDKINWKLINLCLIMFIFFLMVITSSVWIKIILLLKKIFIPILISFSLAYFFNSITKIFNFKSNKTIKIIILVLFIFIFLLIIYLSFPLFIRQFNDLLNNLIPFCYNLLKYDKYEIINYLKPLINNTITSLISLLSNETFNFFFKSIDVISDIVLIIFLFFYFFFKMDEIKNIILKLFSKHNKIIILLKNIDIRLTSYLKSLFIISFIEIVEYTIIYFLIGHPNYLLIGFLAGITTIIPYFGAIFTNLLALITATFSSKLFILSSLVIIICPIIDSYLIDPKIYHKNIDVSPIKTIISLICCSNLFGIVGVIIAIPIVIVMEELFKIILKKNTTN